MGMYDNVIIAYQLPNNANKEFPGEWQTKDFNDDPNLDWYTIHKDGSLYKSTRTISTVKEGECIYVYEPFDFIGPAWFINSRLMGDKSEFKDFR